MWYESRLPKGSLPKDCLPKSWARQDARDRMGFSVRVVTKVKLIKPRMFPDFFLVGAPRCGTTAMTRYLRENPSVCFSEPKETFFFSRIAQEQISPNLQTQYIDRFFPHCNPGEHLCMGEGSVSYIYDTDALKLILDLQPESKFIAMVRDPLEMLPSYHLRMLYLLEENAPSLDDAWDLQEKRAEGNLIPDTNTHPLVLQYRKVGSLGSHIQDLFELAGRHQCHVVVFDDFREDPAREYRRVLEFIGARDDGRTDFRSRQSSKTYRSYRLQRLIFKPPKALVKDPDALRARKSSAVKLVKRLRKSIERRNRVRIATPAVSAAILANMQQAFSSDVDLLGELLDRDLSHWLGRASIQ